MSRRMGGGRLRPAPRTHRPPTRFEPGRPTAYGPAQPHEVGVEAPPDDVMGAFDESFGPMPYDDDGPTVIAATGAPDATVEHRPTAPATVPTAPTGPTAGFDPAAGLAPTESGRVEGVVLPTEKAVGDEAVASAGPVPLNATAAPAASDAANTHVQQPGPPWRHGHGAEGPAPRFAPRGPAEQGAPQMPAGPGRPPMPAQMSGGVHPGPDGDRVGPSCTAPQLRRFIKSRAYVPMHELRRRFGIVGGDDDVASIDLEAHRIFVGLPPNEARLLGELLRGGEIGAEFSMDPQTPVVVGVYAMRPVPRS